MTGSTAIKSKFGTDDCKLKDLIPDIGSYKTAGDFVNKRNLKSYQKTKIKQGDRFMLFDNMDND